MWRIKGRLSRNERFKGKWLRKKRVWNEVKAGIEIKKSKEKGRKSQLRPHLFFNFGCMQFSPSGASPTSLFLSDKLEISSGELRPSRYIERQLSA